MRIKRVLPDSLYKELGGYTPSFYMLNKKLDIIQASVLMCIIDKMKEPGKYVGIKTEHIANNLGLSWRRVHPVLQKLRDKGLINIKEDTGGKFASKQYRADLIVLGALFGIPPEDFTRERNLDKTAKGPRQNSEVTSTKQRTKQSLQSSVKGKKDTPTSYLSIDTRESAKDKRTRIWAGHLEEHDECFMQTMWEHAKKSASDRIPLQTVRFVVYFVLYEQWIRNKRQGIPKPVPDFIDHMYGILRKRWVDWEHMWEYDQLAAQIADKAGIFREVDTSSLVQIKQAGAFYRLYKALHASSPVPECMDIQVQLYIRFLEGYAGTWKDGAFKFKHCVAPVTIEAFDAEHSGGTGKQPVMGYFNATY